MKWKQLTGVLCDKKIPIKLKDKVYKTVIKPTMTYGAECWAVRKKDENRLHVADMMMLRWIRGKTRKDHVRNKTIQEDAKMCHMSTFHRSFKHGQGVPCPYTTRTRRRYIYSLRDMPNSERSHFGTCYRDKHDSGLHNGTLF